MYCALLQKVKKINLNLSIKLFGRGGGNNNQIQLVQPLSDRHPRFIGSLQALAASVIVTQTGVHGSLFFTQPQWPGEGIKFLQRMCIGSQRAKL